MAENRPTFQHLVDPQESEESAQNKRESAETQEEQQRQEQPIQIKLPLQLDFDELAGSMIEKNQRSRMNCVVEKRRAEEVMDHQPKTVRLPFGVNLTTDPRYEHITGERMAIFCESGNDQRHVPTEQQMTPVVVPIPIHHPVPVPHPVHIHPQRLPQVHPQMTYQPQMPPRPQMQRHHQRLPEPHPQFQPHFVNHPPQPLLHNHIGLEPQPQPHSQLRHQVLSQQVSLPPQVQAEILQQLQQSEETAMPIHIIEEEHVIPLFQARSRALEGSAFHHSLPAQEHPVPSDTVKPPPPPFHRLPVHVPAQQTPTSQEPQQQESQLRPHYVQPRSIRSVDSVFENRRGKRAKRCACDCAC